MPVGEQDETEPVITRGFGSSRKKARPKISSYFSHRTSSANHGRSSIWSADQRTSFKETISSPHETWPEGCEPDPDQMMDSMMRTLMAEPYRPLDVKHNSPLLMIFEGFRNLRDENASLMRKLKYEVETRFASHHETERERQKWQQEREEYKAEVKRLELIIAKDKEGVAGVFRARQGSILRNEHRRRTASGANTSKNDPRETVFEFLERTRVEDDARAEAARKAQRGWSTPFLEEQKLTIASSTPPKSSCISIAEDGGTIAQVLYHQSLQRPSIRLASQSAGLHQPLSGLNVRTAGRQTFFFRHRLIRERFRSAARRHGWR